MDIIGVLQITNIFRIIVPNEIAFISNLMNSFRITLKGIIFASIKYLVEL